MPVGVPGRSHVWVHETQQMVEMQKKLVQRGDEIAAVTHQHGREQVEGGEELAKLMLAWEPMFTHFLMK